MSLVISSLDVSATGYTDSSRKISMLSIPTLPSDNVVSDWLLKNIDNVPNKTYFQFMLIADTLLSVPRLIEAARSYIVSNKEKVFATDRLSAETLRELYRMVFGDIRGRYSINLVHGMAEKNYALIYGTPTAFDNSSSLLIRKSYFSRHPMRFTKSDVPDFTPEGSLFMLAAYDASIAKLNGIGLFKPETVDFNNENMLFYNTFMSVLNTISSESQEGDALEEAGVAWLIARLVVARQVGKKTISPEELFKIGIRNAHNVEISEIATPMIGSSKAMPYYIDTDLVPPIFNNSAEYASKFNDLVLVETNAPCKVYKSSPGQNYDVMLVSMVKDEAHVVFVDMKSKDVFKEGGVHKLNIGQYNQIQTVVDELIELEASGEPLSPVSKALVVGNYSFIYMTTHSSYTAKVTPPPPNIIVMRQENTKAFMGLLWEFYCSVRSMLDNKK